MEFTLRIFFVYRYLICNFRGRILSHCSRLTIALFVRTNQLCFEISSTNHTAWSGQLNFHQRNVELQCHAVNSASTSHDVSHWVCQSLGMSVIGYVSHLVCQSFGMSVIGYFSHWVCQSFGMSVIGYFRH